MWQELRRCGLFHWYARFCCSDLWGVLTSRCSRLQLSIWWGCHWFGSQVSLALLTHWIPCWNADPQRPNQSDVDWRLRRLWSIRRVPHQNGLTTEEVCFPHCLQEHQYKDIGEDAFQSWDVSVSGQGVYYIGLYGYLTCRATVVATVSGSFPLWRRHRRVESWCGRELWWKSIFPLASFLCRTVVDAAVAHFLSALCWKRKGWANNSR